MTASNYRSVFQDIRSRELNGWKARKRPLLWDEFAAQTEPTSQAVTVGQGGDEVPPLAVSYCKTIKNSHILAVSDEEGFVSLHNTSHKFSPMVTSQENAEKARVLSWFAHDNAVFDMCWIKGDNNMLTASGDQTMKMWDVQQKKCIGVLIGHKGSVKSICSHPTNSDLVVSGSRDGSFALWDLRCKAGHGQKYINSTEHVTGAHASAKGKRVRHCKAASMSITSVLYLKDEVSIATAGAVDSIVKFWDTRNLKAQVTQTCPHPESAKATKGRLHGITSLSQDQNGLLLSASCRDNRIYLYNVLQVDKGPVSSFTGCEIESFFVKSVISPDASHILSGSSDRNAYIWQVDRPNAEPVVLESHDGEVTAVDWCQHDLEKFATSSDDLTVRFWSMGSSCLPPPRSFTRRRVMALPSSAIRKLNPDIQKAGVSESPSKIPSSSGHSNELSCNETPAQPAEMPEINTPKSYKRKQLNFNIKESIEKTPESAVRSPSSVLQTPSSIKKRTIKDYFLGAS
ncbi:hypothetical protein V2J09_011648 [Rumex salicifolius]